MIYGRYKQIPGIPILECVGIDIEIRCYIVDFDIKVHDQKVA